MDTSHGSPSQFPLAVPPLVQGEGNIWVSFLDRVAPPPPPVVYRQHGGAGGAGEGAVGGEVGEGRGWFSDELLSTTTLPHSSDGELLHSAPPCLLID